MELVCFLLPAALVSFLMPVCETSEVTDLQAVVFESEQQEQSLPKSIDLANQDFITGLCLWSPDLPSAPNHSCVIL